MTDPHPHRTSQASRRQLLTVAGLGLVGSGVGVALADSSASGAPAARRDQRSHSPFDGASDGWGPLRPAGPELALPRGFSYRTFGAAGSRMSDGLTTPNAHDGQGLFDGGAGRMRLLRNHEIDLDIPGTQQKAIGKQHAYDPAGPAGVVSSLWDTRSHRLVESFLVLNGTLVNCSGSPTPWGSWLSCEETTDGLGAGYQKPHGYVFEVPSRARGPIEPHPLKAMGRFEHECAPVDPVTGIVYMTEDNGDPGDGFYRFLPHKPGRLGRGGVLQMLAVDGDSEYDTATGQRVGEALACHWVTIAHPDPSDAEDNPGAVYVQGRAKGGTRFLGLEGAAWHDGGVTFVASEAGDNEEGQIWRYVPKGPDRGVLTLLFESPNGDTLDQPDSIEGGAHDLIVMAEDGDGEDIDGGTNFLRLLTPRGRIVNLAQVIAPLDLHYWDAEDFPEPGPVGASEMAGPRWSPDGRHLFVNIQYPGVTAVITGPWSELS